jgi:hypothetical protein
MVEPVATVSARCNCSARCNMVEPVATVSARCNCSARCNMVEPVATVSARCNAARCARWQAHEGHEMKPAHTAEHGKPTAVC